jgi:3',5'-cyclic-nucleotide phosphodiesterase
MNIIVLGAWGGEFGDRRSSAYRIDDTLLVDCGGGVLTQSIEQMSRIAAVYLTHAHLDHVYGLPLMLDVRAARTLDALAVHGSADTLAILRRDLFGGGLWPDYERLPRPESPFLRLVEVPIGEEFRVAGLRVLPFPAVHSIPATGCRVTDDAGVSVLFSGDTGPGSGAMPLAREGQARALFVEVSLPDRLRHLALRTGHLTPALIVDDLRSFPRDLRVLVIHRKPAVADEVDRDLEPLLREFPNLSIAEQGRTYTFEPWNPPRAP